MENTIKKDNHVLIKGWMVTELELKGSELLLFAIIHGFSQTENQSYTGSLQYLADWATISKSQVSRILTSLFERNLITKKERIHNGVKFCEYSVNNNIKNEETQYRCTDTTPFHLYNDLCIDAINNKENNNIINSNNNYLKENNVKTTEKEPRHRFGEFGRVLLTDKEYNKLVADFGQEVINEQIMLLDEYIEGNNNKNKYTNFNLVLRKSIRDKWFVRNSNSSSANKTPRTSEPDWLQKYVDNFENGVEDL